MKYRQFFLLASGFLTFCFIGINLGANFLFSGIGIDFTQDRLFTLSKPSIKLVKKIQNPIYLDFYYSKSAAINDPQTRSFAMRIKDLLNAYSRAANGKIILNEIDVVQFSPNEDKAIEEGLIGLKDSEGAIDTIYLGLVARSGNIKTIIPVFQIVNERKLEIELSHIIADFINPNKKTIALISDLDWLFETPNDGTIKANSSISADILSQYKVLPLDKNFANIPQNIDALMIAQPWDLSPAQQYLLDQYIMKGGKILALIDPASSVSQDIGVGRPIASYNVNNVFENLGFIIAPQVLLDKKGALPVKTIINNRQIIAPQPLYFNIKSDGFNPNSPISNGFAQGINFATTGIILNKKKSDIKFENLILSSNDNMEIDSNYALSSPKPQDIFNSWQGDNSQKTIAALISGSAKSAFNIPPFNDPNHIANSIKDFQIIAIADVDFASDGLYKNEGESSADNDDFIMNALDVLTNDNTLLGLRSRKITKRNLEYIDKIKADAQAQILTKQAVLETSIKELSEELKSVEMQNTAQGLLHNNNNNKTDQEKIKNLKLEINKTRAQLRDVQNGVLQKIDFIKTLIIGICAIIIPALFLIFGIINYNKRNNFS